MLLQHVHRPLQNGATVANACSQPSGWSVRLLATRPLGAHGIMFSGFAGSSDKPVRLRRVRIVQGSRANRLQDDHDGLGLLRGFSGIREQLFAGTRKGRWARSGQATRGQVKPWAGSGQTTWKRAPDVIRNSFNDWSYLSYEMPRETR